MSPCLRSVRQFVVLLQLVVELAQRVVDGPLPEGVLVGGSVGGGECGGRAEGLREKEDLGAEEGDFEIDDGGCTGCHHRSGC